ncbi:MAG: 5'-nucleotidase C-terminal domain-containing protein [Bacteroidales bacterium]|nr:5'-nucleotidase C-terminal domain-containing protein [Bacteroidales bacterium]MBQ7489429.1 5'-nucleotidase C-terminal domain-containing protein [Bacteroidales bacterium]
MKHLLAFLLFFGSCGAFSQSFDYHLYTMDKSYDKNYNPAVVAYMDSIRPLIQAQMGEKIGVCAKDLHSFQPQSPLSNLLTDIIFKYGNEYSLKEDGVPVDLSLLNIGGIRTSMKAGDITVGNIFEISPFDNTLVIIALKGKELKKVFAKFSAKYSEPFSNAKVVYKNGQLSSLTVNGGPVDDNRVYRLVTLDFVQTGGDNILTGVDFESVTPTGTLERDLIINYIRNLGTPVTSDLDDRVVIE